MNLTTKQRAFVEEYLGNGRNAAKAYRAIYGGEPSAQRAASAGWKLLQLPQVASIVAQAEVKAVTRTQEAIDRYAITRARVAEELGAIGFSDLTDYMRPSGSGDALLSFADLSPRQRAALAEVTVETFLEGRGPDAREVRRVRFKLHSKTTALSMLNSMHGWDTPSLDTPEGQIDVEKRARVRAEMLTLLADMARPRPRLIEGMVDVDSDAR